MILGVFLGIGESFRDFKSKGQDELIKEYLLKNYSLNFDKVFVYSYDNEQYNLFENVYILPNKYKINRIIYSIFLPFFYSKQIRSCHVLRGLQLTGGIPCLVSKIVYHKKYVINYGYNYLQMAKIEKKFIQYYLYKLISIPILKFADIIIITAKHLSQNIIKYVPKSKIELIPNGVNTSIFKKLDQKKDIDIIYVGRLERQKNLVTLIKAIAKLKRDKLKLVFVGSGSLIKFLLKLALKYHVNLQLSGSIPHTKLPAILNRAKIFVLPSLIEGQPKALLEAMSCEIPVIASNIPSHREIIINNINGILTRTNSNDIAHHIKNLISNSILQKKLTVNARKTIISSFDAKKSNLKEIVLLQILARKIR